MSFLRPFGDPMPRATRFWILLLILLVPAATLIPILAGSQAQSVDHLSMRGEMVTLFGHGPYRHMASDVAVQGLAQDWVTLLLAWPLLIACYVQALRGGRRAWLALSGVVAYLCVQYFLYLGMAAYNELFLLWVALLMAGSQALFRLLLARPLADWEGPVPPGTRRFVGGFLLLNGSMIVALWLGVILPPLMDGSLYPKALGHLTTLVVQGYDLALLLPASFVAGWSYLKGRSPGGLLAPVYAVFLALQMTALLAKIAWMAAVGVNAGPALVVIPLLLVGAMVAAGMGLKGEGTIRPLASAQP